MQPLLFYLKVMVMVVAMMIAADVAADVAAVRNKMATAKRVGAIRILHDRNHPSLAAVALDSISAYSFVDAEKHQIVARPC